MNQVTVAIAIALLIGSFTAGVVFESNSRDAKELQYVNEQVEAKAKDDAKATAMVEEKIVEKIKYKTQWKTKYKNVYVNRTCKLDDNSLLIWQTAQADATTKTDSLDAALPGANTAE